MKNLNYVAVNCPKCGRQVNFETTSGNGNGVFFTLDDLPSDVLQDVSNTLSICVECRKTLKIDEHGQVTVLAAFPSPDEVLWFQRREQAQREDDDLFEPGAMHCFFRIYELAPDTVGGVSLYRADDVLAEVDFATMKAAKRHLLMVNLSCEAERKQFTILPVYTRDALEGV